MPMKQILVIAAPGRLQEGLQALLATLGNVAVVVVPDAGAAQAQVAQRMPHLVIIAGHHAAEMMAILAGDCPSARFMLLVDHARHQGTAEEAGADTVLVEGTPPRRLLDAASDLLASVSAGQMEV